MSPIVSEIEVVRSRLLHLASPPGLFHTIRVRTDGLPFIYHKLAIRWQEFLGSIKPFELHDIKTLNDKCLHQGCYYGDKEKLDEYSLLASQAHQLLQKHGTEHIPKVTDTRQRRNRWTLELYETARKKPDVIDVVTNHETGNVLYPVVPGHRVLAAIGNFTDSVQREFEIELLQTEQYPLPVHLYAAIDVALASVTQLDLLIGKSHAVVAHPSEPIAIHKKNPVNWPPDGKWHFREGEFAFNRKRVQLKGILLRTLQHFATATAPVTGAFLSKFDSRNLEPSTVRSQVSDLRKVLRKEFNVSSKNDPLPLADHGAATAWKLDESLLRKGKATKNQRFSSAKQYGRQAQSR